MNTVDVLKYTEVAHALVQKSFLSWSNYDIDGLCWRVYSKAATDKDSSSSNEYSFHQYNIIKLRLKTHFNSKTNKGMQIIKKKHLYNSLTLKQSCQTNFNIKRNWQLQLKNWTITKHSNKTKS